jgi:hypothetical protein
MARDEVGGALSTGFGAGQHLGQRPQIETEHEHMKEVIDFRPSPGAHEYPLEFGGVVGAKGPSRRTLKKSRWRRSGSPTG